MTFLSILLQMDDGVFCVGAAVSSAAVDMHAVSFSRQWPHLPGVVAPACSSSTQEPLGLCLGPWPGGHAGLSVWLLFQDC